MATTSILAHLPSLSAPLEVLSLRGIEELSGPFRFDLVVALPREVGAAPLVRENLLLRLDTTRSPSRVVAGWVSRVRRGGQHADGTTRAHLRVVPHWSRLGLRRTSRIFQDLTTAEIAVRVAAEHGVRVEPSLLGARPKRGYAVQYQESDRRFLERLFADEGIAYFFAEPGDADTQTVVLVDHATRYRPIIGDERLHLRGLGGGQMSALDVDEDGVTSFDRVERDRPDDVMLRDFDLRRPSHPSEDRAPGVQPPGGTRTWYEHHGPYGEDQPIARAAPALEQVRRRADLAQGSSLCRRLAPGHRFSLEGENASPAGAFSVVRVEHRADVDAHERPRYDNTFIAVPASFLFRPPRPRRRVQQAMETATVVGPESDFALGRGEASPRVASAAQVIHTDELGRIKVQFHWDREGAFTERSSCWLRVSQTWSGAGWGTQFIPRVGMEVIVGFLGGDPDRPIVLGCVDNATHLPPFALPRERTRSGLRTDSVGAEGFNELSFEDEGGAEQIRVRAQRDLDVQVLNDRTTSVGHDERITVHASRSVEVLGQSRTLVAGPSTTTRTGHVSTTHGASSAFSVRGDRSVDIGASQHVSVGGTARLEVGSDRTETVGNAYSLRAGLACSLLVGTAARAGQVDIRSTGQLGVGADGAVTIQAGERLRLECGEASIELTNDSIVLRAPHLLLIGSKDIVAAANGPSLELTDKAQLLSGELRLLTKAGSLELADDTATLKSNQIKLTKPSEPPSKDAKDPAVETVRVKVKLADADFVGYGGRSYEARGTGVKIDGKTDGDGWVDIEVPKALRQLTITLWTGEYPTGPRRDFALSLVALPSVDLVAGAQIRLKNLGYYAGGTNGEHLDGPTRAALQHFQHDHELPSTGELDDRTKQSLVERYGE